MREERKMTIVSKIKENAEKYPDRVAYSVKTDEGVFSLSWFELDDYSDRLASFFVKTLQTRTPIVVSQSRGTDARGGSRRSASVT